MRSECWVFQCGIVPYEQAWSWQKELAERVAKGFLPPVLLLLEHLHTYTVGRLGNPQHILWDAVELTSRQIAVYWVDRGGDVTYHGPGQLVGYPIFPLSQLGFAHKMPEDGNIKLDVISFVEQLEQILISTLRQFGVLASTRPGLRGVWIPVSETNVDGTHDWKKIASIGIKLTAEGVTQHGFALNIDPQMEYWQGIVPCGIQGCKMTCLADLIQPVPKRDELIKTLIAAFGQAFQLSMVEIDHFPFDTSLKSHYTIPRGGR